MTRLNKSAKALLAQCDAAARKHPVVWDGDVLRFKADPVVSLIVGSRLVDLNQLCVAVVSAADPQVSRQSKRQLSQSIRRFYRNMGYSVSGYLEVFDKVGGSYGSAGL
jgi:hypothetical protein